jgi:hypothetical protein
VTSAFGLTIGYVLGSQYAWLESGEQHGLFPPEFLMTLLTVAIIGGAGLIGLLLLIGDATRGAGKYLLVTAAVSVVGWPIGNALGARWQYPVPHLGEAVLELDELAGARLVGAVTCWTQPNSDVIASIDGGPMGDIGIDRLRVGFPISPGTGAIDKAQHRGMPHW